MSRFVFAQLADPQVGFQDYDSELLRLRYEVDLLNGSDCQAAVVCGDMMHRVTSDSLAVFRSEMSRLRIPVHYVAGNHDVGNANVRVCYEEAFGPACYTADLAPSDLRLIVIDSNRWMLPPDDASAKMDQWFQHELERAKQDGKNVIVASHFPVFIDAPDEPETYFNLPVIRRKWLLDLMSRSPVRAFLSGHTHTAFSYLLNGILFSSGETTSVAFDQNVYGFRKFVYDGGMLHFQTIPVS